MAKNIALGTGIVFILLGILGFIGNPLVGDESLIVTNGAHDLLHLISGLVIVLVALSNQSKVAITLKSFGVLYLVIALLGFFAVDSTGTGNVFSLFTVNTAGNWLHVVLSILVFAAGVMSVKENGNGDLNNPIPNQENPQVNV